MIRQEAASLYDPLCVRLSCGYQRIRMLEFGDDGMQHLKHARVVVRAGGAKHLKLQFKFMGILVHRRRNHDLIMTCGAHVAALTVGQQLLIKLFAGTEACDDDADGAVGFIAVKPYHLLGKIEYAHGLAHIEYECRAGDRNAARLKNKLRGLGDGHKIAGDLRMRDRDRPAKLDLTLKKGNDRAV